VAFFSKLGLITGEYLFLMCYFKPFAMLRVPSAIPNSSKLTFLVGSVHMLFHFATEIRQTPTQTRRKQVDYWLQSYAKALQATFNEWTLGRCSSMDGLQPS